MLELSHRGNSNNVGSGSEGENCCWVQVKSKTYWPPPSHTTNIGSAHRDNNAMDNFGFGERQLLVPNNDYLHNPYF